MKLSYSKLKEDDSCCGWDKDTIEYVTSHESTIKSIIKSIGKTDITKEDVDDIYMDSMLYFYRAKDYDINLAYEKSSTDGLVSLEGYVNSCVRYCVIRHVHNKRKDNSMVVHDDDNDSDLSLIDMKAHTDNLDIKEELAEILKAHTSERYKYGVDLYQVIYTKLKCLSLDISESDTEDIHRALGVEKRDIERFDTYTDDGAVVEIAKAVASMDINNALKEIRKFVYSPDSIDKAIEYAKNA